MPMLLMGDEVRRTQWGNNNAYCQDDQTSWFDWTLLRTHADVIASRGCSSPAGVARRHAGTAAREPRRNAAPGDDGVARRRLGNPTGAPRRTAWPSGRRAWPAQDAPHHERVLGRSTSAAAGHGDSAWRRWIDTSLDSRTTSCRGRRRRCIPIVRIAPARARSLSSGRRWSSDRNRNAADGPDLVGGAGAAVMRAAGGASRVAVASFVWARLSVRPPPRTSIKAYRKSCRRDVRRRQRLAIHRTVLTDSTLPVPTSRPKS
jgi:hypothetical protein